MNNDVCPSVIPSLFLFFFFNEFKSTFRIEIGRTVKKLETILVLEERYKALVEINTKQANSWAVINLKKCLFRLIHYLLVNLT